MLEIHPLPAWASSATGHRATGLGFIGYPPPCHPLPATGHRAARYPLPATGYRLPAWASSATGLGFIGYRLPTWASSATGYRPGLHRLPATGLGFIGYRATRYRAMCVRSRVKSEGEGYAHAKPG